MPNSHVARLQKRDFARQIGLFEKPNGHVPRECITSKLFFLKPITCLSIALNFLCTTLVPPTAVAGGDEGFVFESEASDNNNSGSLRCALVG